MALNPVRRIFGDILFRDKATKNIDKLNSKMDKSNAAAMGLNSALAAIGGTAFLKGAFEVTKSMVNASAAFEQTSVAMEVMTGNAETAKTLLKDIEDISIKTPFTPEALTENAKLLLNFGTTVDKIIPSLQMLGDISGGNQDKLNRMTLAFAQVQSQGRLMGQDLLQMINAGFNPLQTISEKTGKSMRQLKDEMSKGLISFKMVNDAFKTATSEGGKFFGMMAKQSETFTGLISTLEGLRGIVFRQIGDIIVKALKPVIKVIIGLANAFIEFSKTERGLATIKTVLIALSSVIGVVFVGSIWAAVSAFAALNIALMPIIGIAAAIVAGITAIVLIVDDLITFFQGGESVIIPFFIKIGKWIKTNFPNLTKFILKLISLGQIIGKVFITIGKFIIKLLPIDLIKAAGELILDVLMAIPNTLLTAFKVIDSAIGVIIDGITKSVKFVTDLIEAIPIDKIRETLGLTGKKKIEVKDMKMFNLLPGKPVEGMATGGTLSRGQTALIGEEGPELFTAGTPGTVSPISKTSSRISIKSLVGTINIVVQSGAEAAEEIKSAVMDALNDLATNILPGEMGIAQ
jgi:tape measure domain-containing protein